MRTDIIVCMNRMPSQAVKLLVLDIDGTLLDPQRRITPRMRAAIQAAQKQGIVVTLATGRRYCVATSVAAELGVPLPLIVYDGAIVQEYPSGNVLHTNLFSAKIAQDILDILVRHKLQPIIHHLRDGLEEMWTGPDEHDTVWVAEQLKRYPEHIRRFPYDACCINQPDPIRILAYAPEEYIERIVPEIEGLHCAWNVTRSHLKDNAVLAIMNKVCSKASGIQALAEYIGIELSQVMAIGDDNNDIEMLQVAGWSVAMGQASAAVRAVAHVVTTTNAEDGAALAIERYALGV